VRRTRERYAPPSPPGFRLAAPNRSARCEELHHVQSGLACANMDVQELQIGRQWSRHRERGFEDNFVGVATAYRDKEGFHLGASAARREIGNS